MKRLLFIVSILSILFCVSCKKEMYLFDVPASKDLELSLKLNFNHKSCCFDTDLNKIKYSIGMDTLVNFSPYVEFKDFTNVKFSGVELTNNEINYLGEVRINTPYQVEFVSGGEHHSFQLYFTSLPLVQLVTFDAIENEPKKFGRIILNYPEANRESFNSLIGIELRGMSSTKRDKKSYGFKLINSWDLQDVYSASIFDMRNSNKWILDAMYDDISRLKNKTNFEIWSSLPDKERHISINSTFVELFHNNRFLGVYCFHENITGEVLELKNDAVLIVGKGNRKSTSFRKVSGSADGCPYWNGWEQKFPDPDIETNWGSFEVLCRLFAEADDVTFANEVFEKVDLENVIDYYLFLCLFYGYDNLGKNWCFLQEARDEMFKIIPWDLDATWGRLHNGGERPYNKMINNGFYERLFEVNPQDFKQKVKDRWFNLRNNEFSKDHIFSMFDKNFKVLNNAKVDELENELWKQGLDLKKEEDYIKNWATNRFQYLDEFFSNL